MNGYKGPVQDIVTNPEYLDITPAKVSEVPNVKVSVPLSEPAARFQNTAYVMEIYR